MGGEQRLCAGRCFAKNLNREERKEREEKTGRVIAWDGLNRENAKERKREKETNGMKRFWDLAAPTSHAFL